MNLKVQIKVLNRLIVGLAFVSGSLAAGKISTHENANSNLVERPPQFVLLAFDGSKDISMWDETMAFANTVKTVSENYGVNDNLLRFTYFVNPTYYTDINYKSNYITPGLGKSVSCIGWSDTRANIPLRVGRTNRAFITGHEIGSHANSHCDASGTDKDNPLFGHAWTEENWNSEFNQFNKLLFGTYELNKLGTPTEYLPTGFAFTPSDIVGFRSPLLATTPGLWPTLQKFHFRYDTSKTSSSTYWPQRETWGGWNFPLASIKIAGTNRTTLSMDYNWLYFHSGGVSKPNLTPQEREAFKNQMLESYKYYFKINYFGGRGPINIGHHFSKWNQGAYWQGMREFANFVCGKKEVRCVTYSEYATWLDHVDENTMKAYRAGNFEKLPTEGFIKDIAVPALADVRIQSTDKGYEAVIDEKDIEKARVMAATVQLQINFVPENKTSITRDELVDKVGIGNEVLIRAALINTNGAVINWATYKVKNVGLPNESVSDQIENHTNDPETSEAHNLHD